MPAYFLTHQALEDLEEIHDFIADDNARAALRFINLLEKKCESLAKTPAMGRHREELAPGLHSLPVKKYVIFYRQNKGRVEIIRMLHGARDIIALFERDS